MADDKNRQLQDAVLRNDLEAARAALAEGADVHARVGRHLVVKEAAATPLAWARTPAMAELLLAAGADVNAEDTDGFTPLHNALNYKWMDVAELFLRRGADPNYQKQETHYSPVDMALCVSPEAGRMLLAAGGRINAKTRFRLWGKPESLALVEEWPILGSTLSDRDKELMLAARAGNLEKVSTLLRDGASVAARDLDGASARDHALRRHHVPVARVLERAALATVENAKLFLAVLDDYSDTLVKMAPTFDLEARTPDGMTPLMLAARYRRHNALGALLSLKVNLEQRNGSATALVYSIQSGDLRGLLQLLDGYAVFNFDVDGKNPVLDAACAQDDTELLKYLIDGGLDLAPYPNHTGYGETARLLKNCRAGKLPFTPPARFPSWSECTICRELPERMGWCRTIMGENTGEPLPSVTEDFDTFDRDLWKCQLCATYYVYTHEHDNGIPDGWDSEDLIRVSLDVARTRLESVLTRSFAVPSFGERQRIERELAWIAFAPALATPGRKVQISGKTMRNGRRALMIYKLDPGAQQVARHDVPESEHDALVKQLHIGGLDQAHTDVDASNSFVWIRRADGLEVYDEERKILEVAGDRATRADGTVVLRADIARVIAYAADDNVERGIKVVLHAGQEVDLVYEHAIGAVYNYQYNRNDLLFETEWCAHVGHAIARWAGTSFENLI